MNKLKIPLSNDDGVYAEGIHTLTQELIDIAEITVVAPDRNRSGASNSLTLEHPLRVNKVASNKLEPKLDMNDAVWNAKTLEAIEKSIISKDWVIL